MSLSILWTDADGDTHDLYDPNSLLVTEGALGLESAPVENAIAPYVNLDGGTLIKRRRPVRPFVLPLYVKHGNRAMTQIAAAARALQGPGTLTIDDGSTARSLLDVIYESGLEGVRTRSAGAAGLSRRFIVSMLALNPWWHDEETTVVLDTTSLDFDDASTGFDADVDFDGAFENVIAVQGDTTALPVWTIDGPFTTLRVGIQGGQWFQLSAALAAGDQIVVDTRPGNRGPRLNGGEIDWSLVTAESRLWELPTGSPTIIAASTGSTGASEIDVTFRQRWLTP